jgi:hypothetical protein
MILYWMDKTFGPPPKTRKGRVARGPAVAPRAGVMGRGKLAVGARAAADEQMRAGKAETGLEARNHDGLRLPGRHGCLWPGTAAAAVPGQWVLAEWDRAEMRISESPGATAADRAGE